MPPRTSSTYETRATTSPPYPLLIASLTSHHPFFPQSTIPISPISSGLTNLALLPVANLNSSSLSIVNFLLGFETTFIFSNTGLSSGRNFRSTHNLRAAGLAEVYEMGEGPVWVPRETLWMNPCWRRMERMERLSLVEAMEMERSRAREAFWSIVHRSACSGIVGSWSRSGCAREERIVKR